MKRLCRDLSRLLLEARLAFGNMEQLEKSLPQPRIRCPQLPDPVQPAPEFSSHESRGCPPLAPFRWSHWSLDPLTPSRWLQPSSPRRRVVRRAARPLKQIVVFGTVSPLLCAADVSILSLRVAAAAAQCPPDALLRAFVSQTTLEFGSSLAQP